MSADDESRSAGAGRGSRGSEAAEDRGTCTPCRGTGKVISALGEQHVVTCPWCGGSGRFQPGRDAQDSPAEQGSRQPRAERDPEGPESE